MSNTKYEKLEIAAITTHVIARALLAPRLPRISVRPVTIHDPTKEIPINAALAVVNPTTWKEIINADAAAVAVIKRKYFF